MHMDIHSGNFYGFRCAYGFLVVLKDASCFAVRAKTLKVPFQGELGRSVSC